MSIELEVRITKNGETLDSWKLELEDLCNPEVMCEIEASYEHYSIVAQKEEA